MSVLSDADREILPLAKRQHGGFHIACQWYLNGWTPMAKQYAFHQIVVPNVTFLAGIAAGKTTAVAGSYLMDCISTPYFGALNTSVTSVQAELVFEMVMGWVEGNSKLEHLIEDITLRPWPSIEFKNFSYWHFRTMGKDARFIRGSEYDRINVDEAGLVYDDTGLKVLRGRLRGKRPDGTTRMARLDVTTSPTDAPWLRERFNMGDKGHQTFEEAYRSIRATIYENEHLTAEQIALMEKDYTEEMIDVELRALFPDYGMSEFPKRHLDICEDMALNDQMTLALRPPDGGKPKKGYKLEEHPRYGVTHWEMPAVPSGRYVMAGDPGTGDPPKRNAGVVIVARTDTKPYEIVYFDWVFGRGSYKPFLNSFKYAINKYRPVLKGLDSTGPQKALEELAFENEGIEVSGLNFQRDKDAMINALSLAVTDHWFRWPVIKGFRQMRQYRRQEDKKLAQDIVMTMAELAYLCRWLPEEVDRETRKARKANHRNRRVRTRQVGRRSRR